MENIIKAFISVFFTLILVCTGFSIITAVNNGRNADSFLADSVARIENSNYAPSVIAACQNDAANHTPEYTLDVSVAECENDATKKYGSATLTYELKIPFIGYSVEKKNYSDIR